MLDGLPVAEGILVGGHHDARGAVGGGDGPAVFSSDALEQTLRGVTRIDLDEIGRRLARANLDVGEDPGVERHLLSDPDRLGRRALVEMAEQEVVAADALQELTQLAGGVLHSGPILPSLSAVVRAPLAPWGAGPRRLRRLQTD